MEYGARNPNAKISDGIHRAWIESTETVKDDQGRDVEIFHIEIASGKFNGTKLHDVVRIKKGSQHDDAKRAAYATAVASKVDWSELESVMYFPFLIEVIDGAVVAVAPESTFAAFPVGATSTVSA
jgi:hypothetical protein